MNQSIRSKLAGILLTVMLSAFASILYTSFEVNIAFAASCPLSTDSLDSMISSADNLKDAPAKDIQECQGIISSKTNELSTKCANEDTNACSDLTKIDQINAKLEGALVATQAQPGTQEVLETYGIKDITQNLCLTDDDYNNITAVIEEPLDISTTGDTQIRNCARNTVCIKRKEGNFDCISFLNGKDGNPICSSQAASAAKSTPDKVIFTCTPVQVFLAKSGVDMIFTYVNGIYKWGASIIGVIAVLVIVISGIQISAAGGDQTAITNARNRVIQSIIGIVILFLSAIILYTINPTFFTK